MPTTSNCYGSIARELRPLESSLQDILYMVKVMAAFALQKSHKFCLGCSQCYVSVCFLTPLYDFLSVRF